MPTRLTSRIVWSLLIGLTFVARREAVAEEATVEEGFVSLFDGETLNGWEGDLEVWKVADGMIVAEHQGLDHNEFLATRKSYGDFELRAEFRLHNNFGNTGIQFRSSRVPDNHEVSGYQADIGEKYWGCLYDESRRNKVLVQARAGSDEDFKLTDWNQYTIRAEGAKITLKINEATTVEYEEADNEIAREGIIALQIHSNKKPVRVEFRNIRIQELPAK